MRFLLFSVLSLASLAAHAQDPADIFHKTVDLDGVESFSIDVYERDQYEVRTWPGDDILIETSVKLNNGKPHILEFFLKQNRYDLEVTVEGQAMTLVSRDKNRRVVRGTENTTSETVNIVLYVPEDFEEAGAGTYRRVSR